MDANGWPEPIDLNLEPGRVISGKAYTVFFRLIALLMVEGVAWWTYVLWSHGRLGAAASSGVLWLLAALLLMIITVYYVFRSVTTISASHVKQTWIWNKEMELAELAYAKLIRLNHFDWLVAPRLYARTHGGKFASFYASTPEVLQQFEILSARYKTT